MSSLGNLFPVAGVEKEMGSDFLMGMRFSFRTDGIFKIK